MNISELKGRAANAAAALQGRSAVSVETAASGTETAETKTEAKEKNWLQRNLVNLVISLVFLVGLGLLIYPTLADYWNSFHQTRAIMSYASEVAKIDTAQYDKLIQYAQMYNRKISDGGILWRMSPEQRVEYERALDFAGNGNMGYINIEKIGVMLPIYHGTSESVLQTSIGHIEGTSLPVGCSSWQVKTTGEEVRDAAGNLTMLTHSTGMVTDPTEGSHCVLSGHRGLPSAKLFSDLDKLVEGDTFTLNILNETLTYQVDQIRVVEPTDLTELQIEPGMDYCTLVTCTPYGINTHRLLVRGHRVANAQGDVKVVADALQVETLYIIPFIGIPIIVLLVIMMLVITGQSRRRILAFRRREEWIRGK